MLLNERVLYDLRWAYCWPTPVVIWPTYKPPWALHPCYVLLIVSEHSLVGASPPEASPPISSSYYLRASLLGRDGLAAWVLRASCCCRHRRKVPLQGRWPSSLDQLLRLPECYLCGCGAFCWATFRCCQPSRLGLGSWRLADC